MSIKKGFVSYSEKFERVVVTRRSRMPRQMTFCISCEKDVIWLSLLEASAISGHGPEQLTSLIANGDLDFMISSGNEFLVCSESLIAAEMASRSQNRA